MANYKGKISTIAQLLIKTNAQMRTLRLQMMGLTVLVDRNEQAIQALQSRVEELAQKKGAIRRRNSVVVPFIKNGET